MANIEDWNKYMNLLHEHAFVEDDLRQIVKSEPVDYADALAARILFERFGADVAGSAL